MKEPIKSKNLGQQQIEKLFPDNLILLGYRGSIAEQKLEIKRGEWPFEP